MIPTKNANTKTRKPIRGHHVKVCHSINLFTCFRRKEIFKRINFWFYFQLVGRPRLNRTLENPSGKPAKAKPAQALLTQSNESIKMGVQNIIPVNEIPALVNEVVTVTTSETDNIPMANQTVSLITDNGSILNVSNTQEVTTSETENKTADVLISQPPIVLPTPAIPMIMTTTTTTTTPLPPPKILHAQNSQFVQVKPPTTTSARIQSPNVKNFFIRKGFEKQPPPPNQPIVSSPPPTATFITTQATPSAINQLSANKKIIIKSQQILVPANKQNAGQIIQMSSGQPVNVSGTSTPVTTINANVIESPSGGDLSGILDLPILFADNNSDAAVQSGHQIIQTTASPSILFNTMNDRNAQIGSHAATNISNIFINATDGKLPNRPVVISAAKMTKPLQQHQHYQHQQQTTITTTATPTSNKLIFINRNQIKQQIVSTPTSSGHTQIVKGLPTLKLMPTSLASSSTTSTPITLQGNQITKLSPGTKIDLSQLKFVKNTSPMQGSIMKPLIINKAVTGTKNAILIKSPLGGNVQGNVLNRNITVRKVMNVVPNVKQVTHSPVTISNVLTSTSSPPSAAPKSIPTAIITNVTPINAPVPATAATTVPAPSPSPPKTTRKTRNSN